MRYSVEELFVFTFHYQTTGNHVINRAITELSTVGHVISQHHRKSTFNITEIVNKYGLKQETVYQIMKFIFHFPLFHFFHFSLYIQF